MTAVVLILLIIFVFQVFGAMVFMRAASWQRHETDYWNKISWRMMINPENHVLYTHIIKWSKANEPSFWETVRPYRIPPIRMEKAR